MRKHIVITIRYSLFAKTAAWLVSKKPLEQYKAELLAPARLNNRQAIFAKLTLPSLIGLNVAKPDDVNFTVQILTSAELPQDNAAFLNALVKDHDFIEVKYLPYASATVTRDLIEYVDTRMQEGDMYASVRLDDDDALSATWIEDVARHLVAAFDGYVLSHSNGLGLMLNGENQITNMARLKGRLGSYGLAYLSVKKGGARPAVHSIYECGNHTTVDERFPAVLYGKDTYWLRSFNPFNDSMPPLPTRNIIAPSDYLAEFHRFGIQAVPFEIAAGAGSAAEAA